MKIKVFEQFQKQNKFFQDNVENMNWNLEKDNTLTDVSNFHYFKFLEIDHTNTFEQPSYIFPIYIEAQDLLHWDKEQKLINQVIAYLTENESLFVSKKLIPVFLDPLEGNHDFARTLNYIVDRIQNKFTIYFISGDFNLTKQTNKFKFVYNDQWIHHVRPRKKPITYYEHKAYINLNRVARYHRCELMQKIINNNLLTKGFNTWADCYGALLEYEHKKPGATIRNQTFDILDVPNIIEANPTNQIPIKYCESSFIYINTETHYDNEVLFISEKTYKPISIGMPFITLGNPGTLEFLRHRGFVTFSDWLDESYDLDMHIDQRVDVVIKNIKSILKLTTSQRVQMRQEMQEVCAHNLTVYKNLWKKNSLIEKLKLIEKGAI